MSSLKKQVRKMKTTAILAGLAAAIFTTATPFNTAATIPAEQTDEPVSIIGRTLVLTTMNKKTLAKPSTTTSDLSDAEKEKLLLGFGVRTIKHTIRGALRSSPPVASNLSDSEKEKLLLGRAFTTMIRRASSSASSTASTLSDAKKQKLLLDLPRLSKLRAISGVWFTSTTPSMDPHIRKLS